MLSDCKLPFECAHGRPTMVPLVKLSSTKAGSAKEEKLKLWKLKNDDAVPIFNKLASSSPNCQSIQNANENMVFRQNIYFFPCPKRFHREWPDFK